MTAARIPTLDGVRAVSILIVFAAHAGLPVLVNGSSGVTIFFFLSGYLITTLMRVEQDEAGGISVGAFYLRRVLRIFPPMYIALAVAASSTAAGLLPGQVEAKEIVVQGAHLTNYWIVIEGRGDLLPSTLAFWSLAVEEHFYLVFPFVMVALARVIPRRQTQAWVLAGACVAILMWRCFLVFGAEVGFDRVYLSTDTRVDSILLGSVFALALNPMLDTIRGGRTLWVWGLMPAAGIVFWVAQAAPQKWAISFGYTVEGVALAVIFTALIRFSDSWASRLLEFRPIAFLGVLSYSVYLLHEWAIALVHSQLNAGRWADAVAAAVLVTAGAYAMYRWVEKPCARLRRRLARAGETVEAERVAS